jgi:DinB family protein
MPVVRLDAGKDAVRAYVAEQAGKGLAHVTALVSTDRDSIVEAIEGLTEEEATRATLEGEWTPAQVLSHLNNSLDRSLLRLQTMSGGRPWVNAPSYPGQGGDTPGPFRDMRQQYIDGMQAIIDALQSADEIRGRDLTADHAALGPFDWLEWAVYSHHVHTSDHIGQLQQARERLKVET